MSWTTAHRATAPQLHELVPFRIVLVELDEQRHLHVVAWLLGSDDEPLSVGSPVRVVVADTTEGPIPVFELDHTAVDGCVTPPY